MATLTEADYAWCARIGISRDRADFLASCPKLTKCGGHMRHRRQPNDNPNRYMMKSASKYYFRVHSQTGKDTVISLGPDLLKAREQRDILLARLKSKQLTSKR